MGGKSKITTEIFVSRANNIHNFRYDYSKTNYINQLEPVEIICPKHDSFWQSPKVHTIQGCGCPECAKEKKSKIFAHTQEDFIQLSTIIHKGYFNYSNVLYIDRDTKVIIICPEHGPFKQSPKQHLAGKNGCKKCVAKAIANKIISGNTCNSTETFIEKAKEIYGHKYNYSESIFIGIQKDIKIICPNHGPFYTTPSRHLRENSECKKCRIEKSKQNFLIRILKVHGDKYDYSRVDETFTKMKEDIEIICPIHGIFKQTPSYHLRNHGCPDCNNDSIRKPIEAFIKQASEIFNNFYDYSKTDYKNTNTEIKIICPIHGDFSITPKRHLNGHGCQTCAALHRIDLATYSTVEYVEIANKIHGGIFDYSMVEYTGARNKIIIKCERGHIFKQEAASHLAGHGCPSCCHFSSKIEQRWLDYMNVPNDIQHRQVSLNYKNKTFKVDGFIPETNTIYEFYGDIFHGNPKKYNPNDICYISKKTFGFLYERTINREIILKEAGYNLITIWEQDFKEIEKSLKVSA